MEGWGGARVETGTGLGRGGAGRVASGMMDGVRDEVERDSGGLRGVGS